MTTLRWMFLLTALGVALACGGMPLSDTSGSQLPPVPEASPGGVAEAPMDAPFVPLRLDDIVAHGSSDASVVVLVFSDWKCSHCASAWPQISDAVRAHPDAQLRFRTFPLAGPCNPAISREDPPRCRLATAALCAHATDRFTEFAPDAFSRGEALLDESEWQDPEFRACLEDEATEQTVREHAESGTALGLQGTPTFFVRVNGEWRAPVGVEEALELIEGR